VQRAQPDWQDDWSDMQNTVRRPVPTALIESSRLHYGRTTICSQADCMPSPGSLQAKVFRECDDRAVPDGRARVAPDR